MAPTPPQASVPPQTGASSDVENLVPSPQAIADVTAGSSEQHLTFSMVIKKVPNMSLGIDVTYSSAASWTKHGVFISQVAKDGLIAACNAKNEEPYQVLPGDFIFQVNDVHGNTQKMVQEMKTKRELSIHVLRRNPSLAQKTGSSLPKASTDPEFAKLSQPVQALLPQLLSLDEKVLSGIVHVVLERRPWLRKEVLGDEEGAAEEQPAEQPEAASSQQPETAEEQPETAEDEVEASEAAADDEEKNDESW
eukprot:CAMPEP_0169073242 /NCGR_PEP_ID=MMETSP1015-20121227/6636_1 /TAXON_ID=342587 /ORGANISM="Karlodinium micrum, Strain CCMP2283" /LENGTH=249 /DNA_ID=CAMNT_0009132477 /DNA_START=88 /DNA_END=834 /DNA_ORIENTATION=+